MDTKSCDTCLFTFQDTCNELKIPTVLMMGTALGICRDGTYCEGDYDLDVGVFCNKQKVLELFKKLKEKGLIQAECWQNQGWEINQHFWYSNNNEKVLLDIHIQYLKDEEKFFNSMDKVNYKDKTFNIPTPSKDYFNLNYGENWAIPQQGHGTRSRPLKEERIKVNGGPEKSTPMDILDWFNCKIERYEGEKIKLMNKSLRRRIITEGTKRKHGHYGSSMSCLDAVKHLYDNVLTDDDIFIMSKGHGAPALHVVLEEHGIIPPWTIHIEYDEDHGIKATGGSLGQGLCCTWKGIC